MRALESNAGPERRQLVVECLSSARGNAVRPELREVVLRAATESWGNLADFAHVVAALLDPAIAAMVRRAADAWPQRLPAAALLGPDGIGVLAEDRLLHCLLAATTICSRELERFLTGLRAVVLEWAEHCTREATKDAAIDHRVEIGCLLAQQCFSNEYVYVASDDEAQRV